MRHACGFSITNCVCSSVQLDLISNGPRQSNRPTTTACTRSTTPRILNDQMARLNDEMLRLANPILERYRAALFEHRKFDAGAFEKELRDIWNTGYRSMKDFAMAMSEHGRYQEVAAYYMEHSNPSGVISEFKPCLARLYGIRSYHSPDRDANRDQFWRKAFDEEAT